MRNLGFFLLVVSLTDCFLDVCAVGIHSSLSHSVCEQRDKYAETKEIQPPVKTATSESSQLPCGWFQVQKRVQTPCFTGTSGSVVSFMDCEIAKQRQDPSFFSNAQTRLLKEQEDKDSEEERASRIVGGTKAQRGEFPSIVSLRINGSPMCGGTILNAEWVLTAAHCKPYPDITSYEVVAGEYKLSEDDDPMMQTREVVAYILHEKYTDKPAVFFDIAVIRVSPPFDLNDKIKAATLPARGLRAQGKATVAGWGLTSDGGQQSDTLLKVEMPIISDAACADKLGDNNVAPNIICAGFSKGKKDACQGDSGGPLYSLLGGVQTVVGVVSWGIGCAEPNSPGVYTEVAYFVDWIKKQTC